MTTRGPWIPRPNSRHVKLKVDAVIRVGGPARPKPGARCRHWVDVFAQEASA
jgi:hypothetical protein